MGLVSQVFDETALGALRGHLAVGHARYSTTGASRVGERPADASAPPPRGTVALGHNGNLTNTAELVDAGRRAATDARRRGELASAATTTDTDLVTALLAGRPGPHARGQAALEVLPQLRGAFSLVFMDEHTLYAARDPQGVRPLVLGRLERGWVVASETAALDIVGASFVREVEPGELIAIDEDGLRSSSGSPTPSPRAASSSTSTWPARTPRSPGARCTSPGSRWAARWPASTRSRPTW